MPLLSSLNSPSSLQKEESQLILGVYLSLKQLALHCSVYSSHSLHKASFIHDRPLPNSPSSLTLWWLTVTGKW
jgi:hypothetical protein